MRRPTRSELRFTQQFEFPVIEDASKPSVTLHKNGKKLLFKPNDPVAADCLRELRLRMMAGACQLPLYYGEQEVPITDGHKIELWRHLNGHISNHPFCFLLKSYGIEIGTSPTLEGYIRKEGARRQLEETPHPVPEVDNVDDVSLFDRCIPGTILKCVRSFNPPGAPQRTTVGATFQLNSRYLVTGGNNTEGSDYIEICYKEVSKHQSLMAVGAGAVHRWTEEDGRLEEFFDDSENADAGPTIDQVYPERVDEMKRRLAKLDFVSKAVEAGEKNPLYEHVREDAVIEALRRGVVNCKLMRMGKSSESITICELWGSKKIGIIGSKNVRLAYRNEFARLGMKNFVFVNKLSDVDKEGKYYLFTYDFLKGKDDPSILERKSYSNYLHASIRNTTRKVAWHDDPQPIEVYQHNLCPHCTAPLERPILDDSNVTVKASWTTEQGYLCRNKECIRETNNQVLPFKKGVTRGSSRAGTAWASDKVVVHKGGSYVDTELARHARCASGSVRGRICKECGATDGTWTPPRYKRIKSAFSAIVADEVHNCKDIKSQAAEALYAMRARRRVVQTGTLLSNSPLDAYWPMHWALNMPSVTFPWRGKEGYKQFESRFCQFVTVERQTGEIDEETGVPITQTVRKRTPFLLNPPDWWRTMQRAIVRRTYNDPLFQKSLIEAGMKQPVPQIKRATVPMVKEQTALMLTALRNFRVEFESIVSEAEAKGREISKALVISKMAALRTLATSPERINRKVGHTLYAGVPGGGKIGLARTLVQDNIALGKKVFILSDFIEMQCLLETELKAFNPIRLIPSWGDEKRAEAMEAFASDPTRKVFIAGTRAVRESIDASAADVTICMDLLWSPAWQAQAWSRTMAPTPRERTCDVYLMVSQHSIDEYMYEVFYGKMAGAEQALDRKIMSRRAQEFNARAFAELVLKEEAALSLQLRDDNEESDTFYMPDLDMGEDRAA